MSDVLARACAWERIDVLERVWAELARRVSASSDPVREIRVEGLDSRARQTLASLLQRDSPPRSQRVTLKVSTLLEALGLEEAHLRPFLERVHGPLEDRRAQRLAYRDSSEQLWRRLESGVGERFPGTVARWRAAGVPGHDLRAHGVLLERLANILDRLPLSSPTPLPVLAFSEWGDPHALDHGKRASLMLTAATLELAGHPLETDDLPLQRQALQRAGIVADRLSTPTLTWGLNALGTTVLDDMLRAGVDTHAPVHICGATLDRGSPQFAPETWLCVENPSVIELAIQAGLRTPMVCVSGWPSETTTRLLRLGRDQGVVLHYAGDFDPSGLKLATWMAENVGAIVKMPARIYREASSDSTEVWSESVPATP